MFTSTAALPTRRRFKTRRLLGISGVGVLLVLLLTFATVAPARRMVASFMSSTPQVGVNAVLVRGDALQGHVFAPAVVQVPVGSTITWMFADSGANGSGEAVPHNVVGTGFASPVLTTETYSYTFTKPGSYQYVCTLHAFMSGRVEVVAK